MSRYINTSSSFVALAGLALCLVVMLPAPAHAEISECYCTSNVAGVAPLKYTEADTGGFCHPGNSNYTSCSIIGTCTTMNDPSSCTATASQCSSGLVYDAATSQCVGVGSSLRCSAGTWADYTSGTCVSTCPAGQQYDSSNGNCGCAAGDICSDNPDGTNNSSSPNTTTPVPNTSLTPQNSTSGGYIPLVTVPGLNDTVDPTQVGNGGIATFLNNIYKFLIGIAVVLAIIMIIYGGFEYALSEAITSKADGKHKIIQALYGLALVLAPALVFAIINPAILNLQINFQPLNTQWQNYTPGGTALPGAGGTDNNGNSFFDCASSSDCASAETACTNAGGSSTYSLDAVTYRRYACISQDRTRVSDKTQTEGLLTFSLPSCPTGDTLSIQCSKQ